MDELKKLLETYMDENLEQLILSSPRKGLEEKKIRIRPVLLKGQLRFQAEIFRGTQAFHENLAKEEAVARILCWMETSFCQLQLAAPEGAVNALVSKKGHMTVKEKRKASVSGKAPAGACETGACSVKKTNLEHNRKKAYLLEEGHPVPFLVDLGVMTPEGRVVHARYDKFRQINRFLEFIADVMPALPKDRELTLLDFGCGKSYLTFAMYYYLRERCGLDVRIIGLDLKKDVIRRCAELARRYGYDKLTFLEGDIAGYEGCSQVDMVVTLHACDTATDYALYKAVKWDARVILSVPCCQHELNGQIQNETLAPVLKYGLLKERMAALLTDGLRAELLEQQGYDTQILEFIDMEHTPKNILIRAVKRPEGAKGGKGSKGSSESVGNGKGAGVPGDYEGYERCAEALHADLTLARLLAAGSAVTPAEARQRRREEKAGKEAAGKAFTGQKGGESR